MLYSLVRVGCPTLNPALSDNTSSLPIPGIRSSTASGTEVTILHAQ